MRYALILGSVLFTCACCGTKDTQESNVAAIEPAPDELPTMAETGPPVIVYRTNKEHKDHVPVMLAADGVTIESYPDPSDLRGASGPPLPTDVGNGFLLDNRGIGPKVAFLDMDYGTYAALEKAPTMEEIKALITDKDPIASMYNCGPRSRYSDITGEITQIIVEGALNARCKKLR